MSKLAACYCRVSTKKEEQLQSMEMQKQYFSEYCQNNSAYELYRIYADEGISGKSLKNRKAFDQMIKDAKSGFFNAILVKDFSRFARNTVDLLTIVRMLKDIGVEVLFVNYNMTNFGDSELILTMMGALAQEESQALSKKLKLSKNMTAERGRVPNFVFGYDRIDKYNLKINEYEAYWVKKIYEKYVDEGIGTAKIAEYLNENNVLSKKKKTNAWSQHTIVGLIRNELYIGKVLNKKSEISDFKTGKRKEYSRDNWICADRPEFRIIDDELFNKAQRTLYSKRASFHLDKKRPSNKYPLSNLLVCANDGYSFRRCVRKYSENSKTYKWWTCSYRNAKGSSICNNNIRVDEDQLHNEIINFLQNICGDMEDIAKRAGDYVGKELKRRYVHNDSRKELLSELRNLEARKTRLVDIYSDGEIDKDFLNAKLRPINSKIEEIKTALNIYTNYEQIEIDIENSVANFLKRIGFRTDDLLSNVFLKTIFERFVVHDDGKITAVLKIDSDAGLSMDIPFGEIVDDSDEQIVPECDNRT
ncbi:MAG TPA: recombinase family protein [Clostridia bacterium]|nr:recombinase family protein [Clostridia bacterium]